MKLLGFVLFQRYYEIAQNQIKRFKGYVGWVMSIKKNSMVCLALRTKAMFIVFWISSNLRQIVFNVQ